MGAPLDLRLAADSANHWKKRDAPTTDYSLKQAGWYERAATGAAIAANLLTLAWLSDVAVAYLQRISPFAREAEKQHFVLSSTRGLYEGALLLSGSAPRKVAHLLGIARSGSRCPTSCGWTSGCFETRYRTIAFIGLGALLLICSLLARLQPLQGVTRSRARHQGLAHAERSGGRSQRLPDLPAPPACL